MPRDRKCYNKDLTREKKRFSLNNPFNKGFRQRPGFSAVKPPPQAAPDSPADKPDRA